MKGVTKSARKSNGLSRMCAICPHRQGKHICHPSMSRVCSDAFVEGFKKGAKAAEKAMKESNNLPSPYHRKMVQYKENNEENSNN